MMLRLHSNSDPWREFRTLQHQMDEVFRGLLPEVGRRVTYPNNGPAFNVADTGASYVIEAELPGLSEGDLAIEATVNSLTIKGARKPDAHEGYAVHRRERGNLAFARSFGFEGRLDLENVKATLNDGVLRLEVTKQPEAQPRQISIKSA